MHLHLHAVLVRPLYHRRRVGGILHAAESDFTDCPDAFLRHLLEVLFYQALFKYDAAAMNLYAAGLERRERLMRQDGQRLGARGILGTAGRMTLAGGNDRGDAAVQLAFDEIAGKLTMRVVAQTGMYMCIKQPWRNGRTSRVDNLLSLDTVRDLRAADGCNFAVGDNNCVAL